MNTNESDKYTPPQAEKKDKAIAVVRAAVSSIPYAGNAAIELMPLLFTAPLERRRQEWMMRSLVLCVNYSVRVD